MSTAITTGPHPSIASAAGTARNRTACEVSVVTMVYKSLAFLPTFIRETSDALLAAGIDDAELVFVNDGSPDASLEYLLEAQRQDPRIKVVDLSRNFGHHKAALAGLGYACGRLVFMIDCDLEVAPATFSAFLKNLRESNADVVYGVQEKRKGGWIERVGGGLFWKIFNRLSDIPVPENVLTERLMTRAYVDALLNLGDRNIFLAGMMYWTGFRQIGIPVAKRTREGASTYSIRKRFSLLIEAITSFSTVPLKLIFVFGVALTFCAMALAFALLIRKLLFPSSVLAGFTTLALLILGVGGMAITMMGVLGLYLSRIFVQTQGRPTFIVRDFYG